MNASRRHAAYLLACILLLFAVIYHKLLTGEEIFTHDALIWSGPFFYFLDSVTGGHIPFWDPYTMTGVPFYPHISWSETLIPFIYPLVLLREFSIIGAVTVFIYTRLVMLAIFVAGSYFLFRRITGSRTASMAAAGILLFAVAPPYWRQPILIQTFMVPFSLYFLTLFLEKIDDKKRCLYLSAFVFVFGVGMNITAPVILTFNVAAYAVVVLVTGTVKPANVVRAIRDTRLIVSLLVAVFALVLMAGPILALYKDSKHGELFPDHRIILKNKGVYKKIMATDFTEDVLSDKFTEKKGVWSSWGNLLHLIYPDMHLSYYGQLAYPMVREHVSEVVTFIGIIPFVMALLGFIYSKSRYRWVAMAMGVIIALNMINWNVVQGSRPNRIQVFFNHIFPPLKMIEVREILGASLLIYLCLLFAIGLKNFFAEEGVGEFVRTKYKQIIMVAAAVLEVKILMTGFYGGMIIFATDIDLLAVLLLIFFCALVYIYRKGVVGNVVFSCLMTLFLFADIVNYNIDMKGFVLGENTLSAELEKKEKSAGKDGFDFFREPFVDNGIAYADPMLRKKSALTGGGGIEYHLFTTKRYYDLLTHVPIEKQFAVSGIAYPIVKVIEAGNARFAVDKAEVLSGLSGATLEEHRGLLYLEDPAAQSPTPGTGEFKRFDEFEDLPELTKFKIKQAYFEFLLKNPDLVDGRREIGRITNGAGYSFVVREFTPNTLALDVTNKKDSYLFYNDGWSEHWKAYDNGKQVPIYIANYNSKAVRLSPGKHRVEFVYDPVHYKRGLLMYAAGLLLSASSILFFYLRFRRGRAPATPDV